MSAGLCERFDHKVIARQFNALNAQARTVQGLHRGLLRDVKTIKIRNLDDVAELLQNFKFERLILAGSQFGPPLISVAALTSVGVKLAGVYWALNDTSRRVLETCRVRSIDMIKQTNRLSFVRLLQELHAEGYVIWLMCDAPGKSRARYDFLGYSINCANLIEVYARLNRCTVIPIYSRLLFDNDVSVHCGVPMTNYENMTQRLLSVLETLIYNDPVNYLWSGTSIIFSDPRALLNGLRHLPDFLKWREEAAANRRRKTIKSV